MSVAALQLVIILAAAANAPQHPDEEKAVLALLRQQQDDWNRGDIEAFMSGYEEGDRLVFTSGGQVRRGWKTTLERYRKAYPDRESMGTLTFDGLEVRMVGQSAAVVLGRWELQRRKDRPHGVFTLVLEKGAAGWRIIHDHTSAEVP